MIRRLIAEDIDLLGTREYYVEVCVILGGVGYQISMPCRCYKQATKTLRKEGQVQLEISHHHTEVSEFLFGFPDPTDYNLFIMLLEVNGVGKKTALALLEELTVNDMTEAVLNGNQQIFEKAHGVGGRTSQRIFTSMRTQLNL